MVQNRTALTSTGTKSAVKTCSARNVVERIRISTVAAHYSTNGHMKIKPGPATRLNLPKRNTTERSRPRTTCERLNCGNDMAFQTFPPKLALKTKRISFHSRHPARKRKRTHPIQGAPSYRVLLLDLLRSRLLRCRLFRSYLLGSSLLCRCLLTGRLGLLGRGLLLRLDLLARAAEVRA